MTSASSGTFLHTARRGLGIRGALFYSANWKILNERSPLELVQRDGGTNWTDLCVGV